MTGRPIVWKHKTFALYRPAAVSLASVLADLPSHLLLNLLFHLIIYFLVGLYPSAGAFFSYYIIATACYLAVSASFRLVGTVCSNYDQANKYTVFMTTLFELLSGYLIAVSRRSRLRRSARADIRSFTAPRSTSIHLLALVHQPNVRECLLLCLMSYKSPADFPQ